MTKDQLQELFARGNEQMNKGNYEYADEIYFSACVLGDPGNVLYFKTFLANLRKKYGNSNRKKSVSLYIKGKKAVAKTPEQLFHAGIAAIRQNPWNVQALLETGDTCEQLKLFDIAVEYYKTAVAAEPENLEANTICAAALKNIADYEGALTCIERVLKHRPTDHDALILRQELTVDLTIHRGKYRSADGTQVREAAASLVPQDEDAMGRHLTVPEQIERRIRRNPSDAANYIELAQYYHQLSEFAQAEEVLMRAVKAAANEPGMVERLLDAQKNRQHQELLDLKARYESGNTEVKDTFVTKQAEYNAKKRELVLHRIQMNPSHAGYRYDYGLLLMKDGKFKEAIAEFQTAKADSTQTGDCLFALGQCFQVLKQYKLAMTHYEGAIANLPEGSNKKKALYQAVKLALALKDTATAETYANQLAAMDYNFMDIAAVLEQFK